MICAQSLPYRNMAKTGRPRNLFRLVAHTSLEESGPSRRISVDCVRPEFRSVAFRLTSIRLTNRSRLGKFLTKNLDLPNQFCLLPADSPCCLNPRSRRNTVRVGYEIS